MENLSIHDTENLLNQVLDMRKEILSSSKKRKRDYYRFKYPFLYCKSITLFDVVFANEYNYLPILNNMFSGLNKIISGEENKENFEKEMGQKLYDHYIQPKLDQDKEKKKN